MRLTFLGVRGSMAAPGPGYVRYGGHTSCIAVARNGHTFPTLALDAGTGLSTLTGMLNSEPYRGTVLLSHLHWDHMQGIPFFSAGDREGSRVDVYMPAQEGRSGRDLLAQMLAPPAFPITPEGLRGDWTFTAVEPEPFDSDGFAVVPSEVQHKGGRTFLYRVEADGASVAYAPDHAPATGLSDRTLAVLDGVDVLVHDAQFVEAERAIADAFGHATVGDAVALAERVGAGTLVLFHHGPYRSDDALDRILDETSSSIPIVMAAEGDTIQLGHHD
jgi:phosphoribosyl 1,2-cyclic phosphodiesterase